MDGIIANRWTHNGPAKVLTSDGYWLYVSGQKVLLSGAQGGSYIERKEVLHQMVSEESLNHWQ